MGSDQLATMTPSEASAFAQKMAARSPEHALAVLDGAALAVIKADQSRPREVQMMSGEQLAFGMRLLSAIDMFRAIVGRRVDQNHKVPQQA